MRVRLTVDNTYGSNSPHSVVDTSRPKSALDNFETTAFTKHEIAGWDADVFEGDVAMSVRSIIVPVDGQHPVDGDSFGACGHQYDRLLPVDVLILGV